MKPFNMYFFSSENNGTWLKTTVYAKSVSEAKKMVSNIYYVDEKKVFAQ